LAKLVFSSSRSITASTRASRSSSVIGCGRNWKIITAAKASSAVTMMTWNAFRSRWRASVIEAQAPKMPGSRMGRPPACFVRAAVKARAARR
jgi:hypothetical protein